MEKNIFQKIKRFLEPIKKSPLIHFRAFLIFSNWGLNSVIHILFLQKITFSLENHNINLFNKTLFLYIIYFIYFYTFEFIFKKYWWTEVGNQIMKDVQSDYIKKYVRLDNNYTEKYWVWKSIAIVDKWLEKWGELIVTLLEKWSYLLVSILFTIYMLSKTSYSFVLIFLVTLIFIYLISNYYNWLCIKYRKMRNEYKNLYTKQLVKILMSKNEIFQSNKVENEIILLDKYIWKNTFYNKKMWFPIYWLFWIPSAIILGFLILIFYFLWNKVLYWTLSLSILIWITWSIIVIQKSIDIFLSFYKDLTKYFIIVENFWDFFDNTPEITWYDTWKNFEYKNWNFEIKNLTYYYDKQNKVFDKFDLEIQWWKILAIVWNSWWWKTTLMKLLAWYIRPISWEIIIDWQKLSKTSLKSYYENIWYLTQEPSVFDWTVLENLMYGINVETTIYSVSKDNQDTINRVSTENEFENQLHQIIKDAKCEFIYELPNWLDTEIWERWVKLSGWQKQRLAIAKIMLKNPKIIFLDEPTSALDSFSEDKITKALHNLFKDKTVIIIAHRLQTVKHADKIIVLEEWKVVEEWTHTSLIKQNWIYKKMLDLQSGF